MNTFEKYINKTENQDLKNFTKYLDSHELAMLEMLFLSFAKEQLRIHCVVKSLSTDDITDDYYTRNSITSVSGVGIKTAR